MPRSRRRPRPGGRRRIAELLHWLPANDAATLAQEEPKREQVRDELAEGLLHLVRLTDVLDVDLKDAADDKMRKNERKHASQTSFSAGDFKGSGRCVPVYGAGGEMRTSEPTCCPQSESPSEHHPQVAPSAHEAGSVSPGSERSATLSAQSCTALD